VRKQIVIAAHMITSHMMGGVSHKTHYLTYHTTPLH